MIPDFKTTPEAIFFGLTATEDDVKEMFILKREAAEKFESLKRDKPFNDQTFNLMIIEVTKIQLFNEATESYCQAHCPK